MTKRPQYTASIRSKLRPLGYLDLPRLPIDPFEIAKRENICLERHPLAEFMNVVLYHGEAPVTIRVDTLQRANREIRRYCYADKWKGHVDYRRFKWYR